MDDPVFVVGDCSAFDWAKAGRLCLIRNCELHAMHFLQTENYLNGSESSLEY